MLGFYFLRWRASRAALALGLLLSCVSGCKNLPLADTRSLDESGMWHSTVEELRGLGITSPEVAELTKARQAGMSDAACVELIRIARQRHQLFAEGDQVRALRQVDTSEATVLELARLGQLGLWTGEAQAIRLVGFSDQIVLAVALRRAAGLSVLSGGALARLKNAGYSEPQILAEINRGATDQQVDRMLAARERAAASQGFVRQHRRRSR